jgi:cytochrome oxidase Cu insertion factor (SCO1/SenC/PrrC family)
VYYQKVPGSAPDEYLMDHMLLIYLMDGDNKFVDSFGPNETPDQIADEIRKHL